VKTYFKSLFNLFSFFFLKKNYKNIVFYSESVNYKNYFIDVIEILIKKYNIKITYVSSDEKDVVKNTSVINIFIGKGSIRTIFFAVLKCKNFIMTLSDLDNSYLKKSKLCSKYIYLFHSSISTHVGYSKKAFWNYDVVFCNGNYHYDELTTMENIYNLKKKTLFKSGYPYLDYIEKNNIVRNSKKIKNILLAPTWINKNNNLFENYSINIIDKLIKENYHVTLRPHPEHFKISSKSLQTINRKFKDFNNFHLEENITSLNSLFESDLLITDYSGISLEYILALKKPVLFINSSKKLNNDEYSKIELHSIENQLRNYFGYQLETKKIDKILDLIKTIENNGIPKKDELQKFIDNNFYNKGKAAEKVADEIFKLI
jgi:hypothetical protein